MIFSQIWLVKDDEVIGYEEFNTSLTHSYEFVKDTTEVYPLKVNERISYFFNWRML